MKKLLLLILLCLPILSSSQVITDGLVGYWPFNGNANDESGNGNDAVVNGAILGEDRNGNANQAYYFDGIGEITSGTELNLQFVTISCWIYMEPSTSNKFIVSKWSSGELSYGIRIDGNKLRFFINTSEGTKAYTFGDLTVNELEWTHLSVTYDGNTLKGYKNGIVSINEALHSGEITTSGSVFIVGDASYSGQNFKGYIDEIVVYNRALDGTEIYSVYSNEFPANENQCQNIYCDGSNIGIGTANTHGYKLAVAGDIITEEIKVATQTNWPDYVFEEDYPLEDLIELEGYIRKNKHLPEIPDAKTIKQKGYNLSEMDAKLLEKIEMLTLYIIEQDKENREQKERIEALEKRLQVLESQ